MARTDCCDNYGFVCHIFLVIVAITGVVLSFLTFFSCDFIETPTPPIVESLPGFENVLSFNFGLFFFTDPNGECAAYPDELDFDTATRCAQVCSFIAPILGAISLILYLWEFCFCRFCCARLFQSFCLSGASMAQGLTFLAFDSADFCQFANAYGSKNSCTISNGAIFSISAFSCFFVVGWLGCTPKPRPLIKRCGNDDDDEDDREEKGWFGKKKNDDDEAKEEEPEKGDDEQGYANTTASPPMLYSAVYE